ncbi:Rpn family recombination-promoting nuclease/putative transposase [Chitinimonas arctica]|uniref:Rpn family recombination-promoting nuclease/putative transposase n=1 Tax=Chitinimonas arctica TaxID=2594795 RepID=A0A516SLL8_9NEIS|nr:Rpn family recombination-promoting nuclease/putative transposase [Chitinimonas arctica]QDQ29043.1 Rpn family recombination-promoting nuclease/putative transposase [Chitinimonas arctica]
MSTSTPHDALFKNFLTDPNTARDFLKVHLPPALRDRCDLSTLRLESSSFIEPDLCAFYSDILYSVETAGQDGYIYVLIEHQSTAERHMAFRLMRYCIAAMHNHLKQGNDRLPLVVPLLFYHGRASPYPYSTDWFELFDQPKTAIELYTRPFPLVDITVIPDEEILQHKGIALLELVQKHIRQRDMLQFVEELIWLMQSNPCTPDQLRSLLNYITQEGGTSQPQVLFEALASGAPQYGEFVMMTIAEMFEQRSLEREQRGLEQGLEQGLELGRQKLIQVARGMLEKGMDKAAVMQLTGIGESDLEE